MKITISADVIGSTSLDKEGMIVLSQCLNDYVSKVGEMGAWNWARVVRGDGIECVLDKPFDLLRMVLLLKCMIKSLKVDWGKPRSKRLGVRMAVALGDLRMVDRERGIIDGDAIYMSGRTLAEMHDRKGTSIVVKCANEEYLVTLKAIFALVDFIIAQATARQSEVLTLKLLRVPESEIAVRLSVTRPNVTMHLQRAGWWALERALDFFESTKW